MARYAQIADITTLYPTALDSVAEWTGEGEEATMNNAQVERALDDASEEIDMYLSSRYSLPLPSVPGSLRNIAVDIGLYKLALMTERRVKDMRTRYEDACTKLKDVRSGKMGLGFAPGDDEGTTVSSANPDVGVIDTLKMGTIGRG